MAILSVVPVVSAVGDGTFVSGFVAKSGSGHELFKNSTKRSHGRYEARVYALLNAIRYLGRKGHSPVVFLDDDLADSMHSYIETWSRNDWRKRDDKPLATPNLWREISQVLERVEVQTRTIAFGGGPISRLKARGQMQLDEKVNRLRSRVIRGGVRSRFGGRE